MTTVTREAPFAKRLWAYAQERFPPGPMGTVVITSTLSTALAAAAVHGHTPARFDLGLVLLAVSYGLLVFLLRILDEFKDYECDSQAYPERILSRGVVTLDDLKRVGWAVGLLALACALPLGTASLIGFGLVLLYALLMAKEFFLGELLNKDVFVYAVVHQPINPLFTGWLYFTYASRQAPGEAAEPFMGWFVLSLFALGFGFEISRKLWTPEEERPELVDSYSSHAIGPRGAGLLALLLLLAGCGCMSWFALGIGLPWWVHIFFALCGLFCVSSVGRFALKPFPEAKDKLQGAVGLGSLLVHVGLIAGILSSSGWPQFMIWPVS